jgi:hypothetical protein
MRRVDQRIESLALQKLLEPGYTSKTTDSMWYVRAPQARRSPGERQQRSESRISSQPFREDPTLGRATQN